MVFMVDVGGFKNVILWYVNCDGSCGFSFACF